MNALPSLACCALLALALAAPAFAQDQAAPSQTLPPAVPAFGARAAQTPEMQAARRAMRASCAADMASLCADTAAAPATSADPAQPEQGAARGRMQCLRGHAAQLSMPCRQALVAMRDARKAAKS